MKTDRRHEVFGVLMGLVGLVLLFVVSTVFCGCASQAPKVEDSNHYRAQVEPQGYPCPECGLPIPDKEVSPNIRTKNECQNCQKIFFGVPVVKKTQEYEGRRGEQVTSSRLRSHGPRSVYESDTDYQYLHLYGESFKETETGYSFLSWSSRDSKVKSRRVIPHWTTRRYSY